MKILLQNIWTTNTPFFPDCAPIWRGLEQLARQVLRPDTTMEHRLLARSTYNTMFPSLELLNNVEVIKGIIQGERDGFDAAVVWCGNDPGLQEAREAVSYPVVGMTEAGVHLACLLGSRFALITVDERNIPLLERNLRHYGLGHRAIAHRPARSCEFSAEMPKWFASTAYTREHVIPAFERTAKACIADGAEVIVTACGGFAALALANYSKISGTEVPVVNGVVAGLKMAELLADLRRTTGLSTSKHLSYRSLPAEMHAMLTKPFLAD